MENYATLVFCHMTAKLRTVVYKLNLTAKLNTINAVRKQSLECLEDEPKNTRQPAGAT